jgi:hypothetical protein
MTMTSSDSQGRPASDLSDEELEQQGKQAHETRNWVFLHGTAEQFATHTSRMLELEQEYLNRHPKRTWQGSGGASDTASDIDVLHSALRSIITQLEGLLDRPQSGHPSSVPTHDPVLALLQRVADAPGGRLHKLEVHQAAREVGLQPVALARLYTGQPQLLTTEQQDRAITEAGRSRLSGR